MLHLAIAFPQDATLSTTGNLLFGNLQHEYSVAGYQFMLFAGDGLNSYPGVQLQQGVANRVPNDVGRYGLDFGCHPSATTF